MSREVSTGDVLVTKANKSAPALFQLLPDLRIEQFVQAQSRTQTDSRVFHDTTCFLQARVAICHATPILK
jgi:hypothetical protein